MRTASYGNLVHALPPQPAGSKPPWLAWRWRVERFADRSDLTVKAGDDTALKVCAMFDMPLARVPFFERMLLRFARSRSGEPLPTATMCYVWDRLLPAGTVLDNAYTRRLRYVVLRGRETRRACGTASGATSRKTSCACSAARRARCRRSSQSPSAADADNTKSESRAYLSDLELER